MDYFVKYGKMFSVPTAVADNLLKLASHDQLKILLYVLSHADASVPSEQIESACSVSSDAVEEALAFWQSVNILSTSEPLPQAAVIRRTAESAVPQEAATPAVPVSAPPPAPVLPPQTAASAPAQASSSSFQLLPSQVAERIRNNRMIAETFRMTEQLAGRPLNHTEQQSIIWMNEYLGLQPDVILMLTAFCAEHDCFNVRYMEMIAAEWQERGITTHALVQEDIQRRTASKTYTNQIMRIFEMTRRPTEKQQAMIDNWCRSNISPEMIRLAYEKTREKKDDKLDFKYLNGIVENWIKMNITTPEQAKAQDDAFYASYGKTQGESAAKAARPSGGSTSFDLSEIDQLINRF